MTELIFDFQNLSVGLLMEDSEGTKTIKVEIQSRHISRLKYRVFIRYEPKNNTIGGILGYSCECANGNRTIGSCSHVAAIIFYLSNACYQSKIVRPHQILTHLFDTASCDAEEQVTIDNNSDED